MQPHHSNNANLSSLQEVTRIKTINNQITPELVHIHTHVFDLFIAPENRFLLPSNDKTSPVFEDVAISSSSNYFEYIRKGR